MRLSDISAVERRLLEELSGRISNRLESVFTDLPGDGPNIGIVLRERGRRMVMELPGELLQRAHEDAVAREAVRVRIKATRDRMLFRPPPAPLPKRIATAPDVVPQRGPFGRMSSPPRRGR